MATHNATRWLSEAVESVRCQSFEDFEFLVVDDGSTDDTLDRLRDYAAMEPRIAVIAKEHTGLADSLNVGLKRSRGEWIARLDADDVCEPTRLARQVRFATTRPGVVLLGSGYLEIDEAGRMLKSHILKYRPKVLVRHLERYQQFFPHSSAFFRLSDALGVGGYNIRFARAQDIHLWRALSFRGDLACLPEPLVHIRVHPSQLSQDDGGLTQMTFAIAAIVSGWLQQLGKDDPSTSEDYSEWEIFLAWIRSRLEDSGFFEERLIWMQARQSALGKRRLPSRLVQFGKGILRSPKAGSLIWHKLVGYGVPKQLAQEWVVQRSASSGRRVR